MKQFKAPPFHLIYFPSWHSSSHLKMHMLNSWGQFKKAHKAKRIGRMINGYFWLQGLHNTKRFCYPFSKVLVLHTLICIINYYSHNSWEQQRIFSSVFLVQIPAILRPPLFLIPSWNSSTSNSSRWERLFSAPCYGQFFLPKHFEGPAINLCTTCWKI